MEHSSNIPNKQKQPSERDAGQHSVVVQNIEDDLYCSQLNTSHCFKNFLFAIFVPNSPAPVRDLFPSVCADCTLFQFAVNNYGWHLKWIVEHALDSEAKGREKFPVDNRI